MDKPPPVSGGRLTITSAYRVPIDSGVFGSHRVLIRVSLRFRLLLMAAVVLPGIGGCIWAKDDPKKVDLGVEVGDGRLADSAAFRDTIGAITYYDGLGPMPVEGYGLVVGLGENGSKDCPQRVYAGLVQEMYKNRHATSHVVGEKQISPEELISDIGTAVVIVQAQIPSAATKGSRLEVSVTAYPGTQTKSLRGGLLLATDLRVVRAGARQQAIHGNVLARALGPIFQNPFLEDESSSRTHELSGTILGGATVVRDRPTRLILTQPSYAWAKRVRDRINLRFPAQLPTADATSPSLIDLRVPQEYRGDEAHFLHLVQCLYLSHDPQFQATRARMLAEELARPNTPHGRIAACFEGLGQSALAVLNELYPSPKAHVSFFAAAAGLRLGDHVAGDILAVHAQDPASPFRYQAIRALGEAKGIGGAGVALRGLLTDEDPRVQVAAYEQLVKRGDPVVSTTTVGTSNFVLDRVSLSGERFVYVRRSDEQRIALFGEGLRCRPPIMYRSPDGALTLTAQEGAENITVLRCVPQSGSVSPPIPVSFDLRELVELMGNDAGVDLEGKVVGLGIGYEAVVRALHHLCTDQTANARFVLEQPNAAELFGPVAPTGRPESEL